MSTLIKNKTITTVNPTTGKSLKDYPLMTNEEASEAVKKCHEAFVKWKKYSLAERAEVLKKIGSTLKDYKEEFSKLMTSEMGKLVSQAEEEIDLCAAICEYTAENGQKEAIIRGSRKVLKLTFFSVFFCFFVFRFFL